MPRKLTDFERYTRGAIRGDVIAGKLVRLACERHENDLKRSKRRQVGRGRPTKKYQFHFENDLAERIFDFFGELKHTKGAWEGDPFILEPWEKFILGSIFGWVDDNYLRRFHTAYNEVAKKNGKSTLAGGLGIYMLGFDDEAESEVYSVATSRDQAKLLWTAAERIVRATPDLKEFIRLFKLNMSIEESGSKFEPLASDYGKKDGLNPHCGLVDELHEHKNAGMWDIVKKSMITRSQPLLFAITTAGTDRTSICWEQREYSENVLRGNFEDDRWFAYIATPDLEDDWKEERTWLKANPNLGVAIPIEKFRAECLEAQTSPRKENSFKRYNLNIWTEQVTRWMPLEWYDACPRAESLESLQGRVAYFGLDLSISNDISALIVTIPDEDRFNVFPFFWCPEDDIERRSERVPYDKWVDSSFIVATPGSVTDYAYIEKFMREFCETHKVRLGAVVYDPMFASYLASNLVKEGMPEERVVAISQGFSKMSEPTNYVERLFKEKSFALELNPVMRWMFSNVAIRTNEDEQIRIDKASSQEKVDGMSALAMSIAAFLTQQDEDDEESIYETRGLISVRMRF